MDSEVTSFYLVPHLIDKLSHNLPEHRIWKDEPCSRRENISGWRTDLGEGLELEGTEREPLWLQRKRKTEESAQGETWARTQSYRTFDARRMEFELSLSANENHLESFKLGFERGWWRDQMILKNPMIGNKTNDENLARERHSKQAGKHEGNWVTYRVFKE